MFKLVNRCTSTNALALVEYLIGTPTHLVYCDEHVEFTATLANTAPEYFTSPGWYKYIGDNIDRLQFIDGCAVYQIINLPMVKNEHYIDIGSLKDQNKQLTQQIAELKTELKLMQEVNLFTNVLFASVYPKWENEAEFKSLPNYKYISLVLNNVVDSFDHNFSSSYKIGLRQNLYNHSFTELHPFYGIGKTFTLSQQPVNTLLIVPPFHTNGSYMRYIAINCGDGIYQSNGGGDSLKQFQRSEFFAHAYGQDQMLNEPVYIYIIGVIAGWIHLNIDKILPYEYLVFIDADANGISFKLVTTKKHEVLPKRFLYDWRRFIVSGVKH